MESRRDPHAAPPSGLDALLALVLGESLRGFLAQQLRQS